MTTNVGLFDRIVRIIIGLGLLAFALGLIVPDTGWNWVGWIGIVPLITGVLGTCPAYKLLGLSTCARERQA